MARPAHLQAARGALVAARGVLVAGAALALTSCAFAEYSGNTMNAAKPYVITRASKDLGCPSKKVVVQKQLGGRYLASGCGRRAEYQTVCQQLQCQVSREGEQPGAWRDRPDGGSLEGR